MISKIEILALQNIKDVGASTIRNIIATNQSITELRKLQENILKKIFTKETALQSFKNDFEKALEKAEFEYDQYKDNNINIISCSDENYPILLKELKDYPIILYCIGNVDLLRVNKNIAIIGTRENSEIGGKIAEGTSRYFASKGYTIVSGLAKGIDAISHKGALDVSGNTIAVLVDILKIYPKENEQLAKRIINNNGLILSENKPGSPQFKNSFVVRDRIQSGLSLGVIPIETDIKGGTMHTVKYSQDQKRLLFVPDIYDEKISNNYIAKFGNYFSKINGIKYLIDNRIATPFTSSTFAKLENLLEERHSKISSKSNSITTLIQEINAPVEEMNSEIKSKDPIEDISVVDVILDEKNKRVDGFIDNTKSTNDILIEYTIQKIKEMNKIIESDINDTNLSILFKISGDLNKKLKSHLTPTKSKKK